MKGILLSLAGIMLCAATLHSAVGDTAVPLQTNQGTEVHAAVTDMPEVIDMSHADPNTWHSLPPAAQVYGQSPAHNPGSEELQSPNSLQQATLVLKFFCRF